MSINFKSISQNEYKQNAKNIVIEYGFAMSEFGEVFIANSEFGICFLGFVQDEQKTILEQFQKTWFNSQLLLNNRKAETFIEKIFVQNIKDLNIFVKGTPFQILVWKELLKIKSGQLVTYSEIANLISKPKAIRAVGSAIGDNLISYIIPCHRVVAKNGSMAGYRWGIDKKIAIIKKECF